MVVKKKEKKKKTASEKFTTTVSVINRIRKLNNHQEYTRVKQKWSTVYWSAFAKHCTQHLQKIFNKIENMLGHRKHFKKFQMNEICKLDLKTHRIQGQHIYKNLFYFWIIATQNWKKSNKFLKMYLFILTVLSLHYCGGLFSSPVPLGLLSSCRVWPPHCFGLSWCGAWALEHKSISSCGVWAQ